MTLCVGVLLSVLFFRPFFSSARLRVLAGVVAGGSCALVRTRAYACAWVREFLRLCVFACASGCSCALFVYECVLVCTFACAHACVFRVALRVSARACVWVSLGRAHIYSCFPASLCARACTRSLGYGVCLCVHVSVSWACVRVLRACGRHAGLPARDLPCEGACVGSGAFARATTRILAPFAACDVYAAVS